jgi:Ca2+/Na+ antiporter
MGENRDEGPEEVKGMPKDLEEQLSKLDAGPKEGAMVHIRVQHDNRLLDRNRHWDTRHITLTSRGLILDTDVRLSSCSAYSSRTAQGIVYDHTGDGLAYAGLVNAPEVSVAEFPIHSAPQDSVENSEGNGTHYTSVGLGNTHASHGGTHTSQGGTHTSQGGGTHASFGGHAHKLEVIPVRDFVSCIPPDRPDETVFELQVLHRDTTFSKLVRLEVDAKTPQMCERWVAAIIQCMQEEMRCVLENYDGGNMLSFQPSSSFVPRASFQARTWATPIMEWLDWIRFPVRSLLRMTIPDVHKPHLKKYWPLAFFMSMVWLAVFAFGVIELCHEINVTYGIPEAILGFTVAAIGTSFPNVISCVAVSKQGRTGMAIANALGANIQNVFLALAVPWTVQAAISSTNSFALGAPGLKANIAWMLGTLCLMVVIVLFAGCRMPRWSGGAFLAIYLAFLANQLGGYASDCEAWPLTMLCS